MLYGSVDINGLGSSIKLKHERTKISIAAVVLVGLFCAVALVSVHLKRSDKTLSLITIQNPALGKNEIPFKLQHRNSPRWHLAQITGSHLHRFIKLLGNPPSTIFTSHAQSASGSNAIRRPIALIDQPIEIVSKSHALADSGNRYYPKCDPTTAPPSKQFTICIFRSEVDMWSIPSVVEADTGVNRLYYVGQGQLSVVDMHDPSSLQQYVAGAPSTNIVWAVFGQLLIVNMGTYTICTSSDDGTKIYLDGPLLVTDDGPHGMILKCGTTALSAGTHIIYVEGYQGYGGFGMELTYSGPDTGGSTVYMPSYFPTSGQYFPACNPTIQPNPSQFTLCIFRSEVGLTAIPSLSQADTGNNRLYYVGQGQVPVISITNFNGFQSVVPRTPNSVFAWAIYGQLQIGVVGSYKLCVSSDDGTKLYVDGPYLLVNNDGVHGMSVQCGLITLTSGAHIIYVEGYQYGGGVGVILTYSGPDTNNVEIVMPSGRVSSQYFPQCDPTQQKTSSQFTVCVFSTLMGLNGVPRVGDAVLAQQISYLGQGLLPVVDMHSGFTFRQYVPSAPDANFVWAIYGQLLISKAGTYSICINSDDGSQLFVDGALLVNDDGYHGMVHICGNQYLNPGLHLIYLVGFQGGGGIGMELTYSGPDTGGQEAFMMNNALPQNNPVPSQYYYRCDPTKAPRSTQFTMCVFRSEIDINSIPRIGLSDTGANRLYYVGQSSVPVIDMHDSFTVQQYVPGAPVNNIAWAVFGQLLISNPGTYSLCTSSDDGTKLYLDGPLLATDDGPHGMQLRCGSTSLNAGTHIVYVEGYQGYGGMGMELTYSGPDTGGSTVYMRSGQLPSSSPSSGQYYSGCNPTNQPNPSQFTMCVFRSEVGLNVIPAISQADSGNNRLYYVGQGQLPVISITSFSTFQTVVPYTPNSQYAWAIYGQLQIGTAGGYNLCINSDDGSKLYVDGPQLLVNNDGAHGMIEQCGRITLTAGTHVVYVEGYQGGGGVGMILTYSGPDTNNVEILMPSGRVSSQYYSLCDPTLQSSNPHQFTVCMFSATWLSGTVPRIGDAVATNQISYVGQGTLPVVDVHSAYTFQQFVPPTPNINYVWAMFGKLLVSSAGTYTMCINSDDGSDLFLDGTLLVTDEGWHGMVHNCAKEYLTSGLHTIYLVGFQGGGGIGMELTYSGPDTGSREIFMRSSQLPAYTYLKYGNGGISQLHPSGSIGHSQQLQAYPKDPHMVTRQAFRESLLHKEQTYATSPGHVVTAEGHQLD